MSSPRPHARPLLVCETLDARRLMDAAVTGFTLMNADTDQPIAPLVDGAVLDLSKLPTANLNVVTHANGETRSVKLGYDGVSSYRVESMSPFALGGNDGFDFYAWTPELGEHTLKATPYDRTNARGDAGDAMTVRFTVVGTPRINVAAVAAGTDALNVTWEVPSAVSAYATRYRITARPGTYWGPVRTIEVDATAAKSASIVGLESFKQYTIDVVALDAGGADISAGKGVAMTAATATQERYLYSVSLPYARRGFRNLEPQIEVFDVNDGHKWVRNIPLPDDIYNARGLAVNAATGRLYLSFFDTPADRRHEGGLLCVDLNTDKVLWLRRYDPNTLPSPDRFALTPDGTKIYMPSGEGSHDANFWLVLNAATGNVTGEIEHVSSPHNTIVSTDGRFAFLEGQEQGDQPDDWQHTVAVVDTRTDAVVRRVGPFRDVVRPFTITGDARYMFACLNNFVGFEVADVETGEVIYTVPVPGVIQPAPFPSHTDCHGIAITPDERFLFLNDRVSGGVQVFDISGLRQGVAPTHLKFIPTRKMGLDLNGNADPAAREDTNNMPGWLAVSYDGKHVYPEGGEIIDVQTLEIVGFLKGEEGLYTHSKFMAEVVFDNGRAVRVVDQFGVGRVR
jgi:hypothetical protein